MTNRTISETIKWFYTAIGCGAIAIVAIVGIWLHVSYYLSAKAHRNSIKYHSEVR